MLTSFPSRISHPAFRNPPSAFRNPPSAFRLPHSAFGFVFLAILWVLNAVFVIIASIQASDGKFYRYPITIRFIQ